MALKAVAWVFIAFRILAAVGMVGDLFYGRFTLNFVVLGIWVGRGLLQLRCGWRTCGLVFIWIALIGIPLICVVALTTATPPKVTGFGVAHRTVSRWVVLLPGAVGFPLALWQYRVLTRPEIRNLFLRPRR